MRQFSMTNSRHALRYMVCTALAGFCLFSGVSAHAQETAPGDACAAGEENYIRQVGGPETTGVVHLMRCDGSNWQQYMTILADGNVGIGTTSPRTIFQVGEDSSADDSNFITIGKGWDATSGIRFNRGASADGSIYSDAGESIYFQMDGTDAGLSNAFNFLHGSDTLFRILGTNGRVGIGVTAPEATLDVAGTDSILFPRGTDANRPSVPVMV